MSDVVKVVAHDDIAVLTFNREGALNAVSRELAREVAATLIKLDDDDKVRGIVLTGA